MASLQEQEADLEAQIQTYRDQVSDDTVASRTRFGVKAEILDLQLAMVQEKASNGAGGELKQLLADLEQLIQLSEGMASYRILLRLA